MGIRGGAHPRGTRIRAGDSLALYERAELYDIAFSYRDFGAEIDVLTAWYDRMTGRRAPARVLELGAGPAQHAREFARRGAEAWALDMSPAMSDYARAQAEAEGLRLEVVTADMTAFEPPRQFDLALLMMNTVTHALTESAVVGLLESVARSLVPGGVFVMEVAHPADDESHPEGEPARQWTVTRGKTTVDIRWGGTENLVDLQRRVWTANVELNANIDGRRVSYVDQVPMRAWKRRGLDEAIQRAGGFGTVQFYGDFAPDAAFERPDAWRMIYVLQRDGRLQR
jgi:SAM-dependent methyltransferase